MKRALAALFPPLAVLASVHELFLRNQADLDGTISVLHPFWTAGAVAAAGALLLGRTERFRGTREVLCLYYGAGAGFVVWTFLRALPAGGHLLRWVLDSTAGTLAFAAAWLFVTLLVTRRFGHRRVESILAVLAVLLIGRETFVLATRLDRRPPPASRDLAAELGATGTQPNVYHLLLDALPGSLFEAALAPAVELSLDGFVRWDARSPESSTQMVLPAILTGRWTGGDAETRMRGALLGEESVFRNVREAGWRTAGFVPRYLYGRHRDAFDLAVIHDENVEEPDLPALHTAAFLRLWVFGVLPRAVSEKMVAGRILGFDTEFFQMAGVDRLSTYAQPLVSRLSLEEIIALEPRLPGRGRYTFVHLLLPHNPYVLRSDCSRAQPGPTDLLEQTRCTLLLLRRFLETLRGLDRIDGSLVLIHGDHGSGEVQRGGRLVPDADAWLRTLVLVKPVGGRGPLRRAETLAEIVDIAPTLLRQLGVERRAPFDGHVLDPAD